MAQRNASWSMVAGAFVVGTALGALSAATLKRRGGPWDRIDPAEFSGPAEEFLDFSPDAYSGTGSGIADAIGVAGDRRVAAGAARIIP